MTVRLNGVGIENVPIKALTVTGPGLAPAVTVTLARPVASLVAESVESVAEPLVTEKPIGWFDKAEPSLPSTCTISGDGKFCPDWALCESPDTFLRLEIRMRVERTKVVPMPLKSPVRAALTVICPVALGERVTMLCAWPVESVVAVAGKMVAAPLRTLKATV